VRRARQGYYGNVTFVDEQIGRILDAVDENTVVLYLSDHGDMLGDHHLWRKSYAYDGSSRIPMLLRAPGVRAGVVDRPVEIRDVLPTLLDVAGIEAPAAIEGRSIVRDSGRKWIDLEHDVCYSPTNHWNALTDGKVNYIFHAMTGEEQLLNAEDNAIDDAPLLREWRRRMLEYLAPRGEAWVKNGNLAVRTASQLHSPNYPKA